MRAALALVVLIGCANEDVDPVVESHGSVIVHVSRDGRAVAGATVIFHGPRGDVQGNLTTDVAGTVRGELDTPGMITVVDPTPTVNRRLVTVTHVIADEAIEVELEPDHVPGPIMGTLSISAAAPPPAGTDHYQIHTPCGNESVPSLPATIPLFGDCAGVGVPVIVMAATPLGSLEDPGTTLAYTAARSDAASSVALDAWSTTCGEVAIKTQPVMSLNLWTRFGGHVFRHAWPGFCASRELPDGYHAYPVLDFGEGAVAHGFAYVYGSLRKTSVLADYPALPQAISVDQSRDMLVGDVELTRFDRGGATWTADVALGIADVVIADLTWVLPGQSIAWRFVLPNGKPALVPEVPAAVQTWNDLSTADERILELRYVDASWTDDLYELHRSLDVPADGTRREYIEQFYPDVRK